MNDNIDHKKIAEEGTLNVPTRAKVPADEIANRIALYQVHATLALVEQQRIANLVALLPVLDNTVRVDGFDMGSPVPTERDKAGSEIRKALGL
jgi:hypothetical protein